MNFHEIIYICDNNTCHASRQISAPGGFFVFIGCSF